MADQHTIQTNDALEAALPHLQDNLKSQFALHCKMETCIKSKRMAISEARIDSVAGICEEENDLLQQLGELEKSRLVLIGSLTRALEPEAHELLTIGKISEFLDDDRAGRRRLGS